MFPISATGPRRRCVAVGLVAALLALLTGCGGGGDDGTDQEAARARLLAAANKLADAPSLEAAISIDVSEGSSSEATSVCFSLAVLPGEESAADDQVALRTYSSECSDDNLSSEVIVIGRNVWASQFGDQWTRGRINPELVDELTDEDDEYDELIEAASDIRPGSSPRSYQFTAPSSAFSQTEDIGDFDVDFVLTLDERGYLSGLVATIEEEGARVVVEEDFEVGNVAPLRQPPAEDVVGPVRQVTSEADLESLVGSTVSDGFE